MSSNNPKRSRRGASGETCLPASRGFARALGAAQAWVVSGECHELADILRARFECVRVVEPLGGVPVACADVRSLAQMAREQGAALVADGSNSGLAGCATVRLGAHVGLAPMGERFCVAGTSRDAERLLPGIVELLESLAGTVPPDGAEAADILESVALQWRRQSDEAHAIASYLRCHPRIAEVRYPGLRSDPSFAVAARTLQGGFGPIVDYRVMDREGWQRIVCDGADPRAQVLVLEELLR